MQVEVWLYDPLAHYHILKLACQSTFHDLLQQLEIPMEEIRFAFINGDIAMLPGSQLNGKTRLHERDQVDIYRKVKRESCFLS